MTSSSSHPERHYELWLFRHGETEWSMTGQHTGTTDLPLTPIGRRRARGLSTWLAAQPELPHFDLILSSPMQRALDTCRGSKLDEHVHVDRDLVEFNYGQYEGLTTPQIKVRDPEWTIWTRPCPGGETMEQVATRVRRVIQRCVETLEKVTASLPASESKKHACAIFAHGHVLRILAACYLEIPPEQGHIFALDTGAVCRLGWEHDKPCIKLWNSVQPLSSCPQDDRPFASQPARL